MPSTHSARGNSVTRGGEVSGGMMRPASGKLIVPGIPKASKPLGLHDSVAQLK